MGIEEYIGEDLRTRSGFEVKSCERGEKKDVRAERGEEFEPTYI